MNRHERRKEKAQWRRSVLALHEEAAGAMRTDLITPINILFHPDADKLFMAIAHWLAAIPEDGFLCFACDHIWRKGGELPIAFVMTRAWDKPDAAHCMITGVCETCLPAVAKNFGTACTESFSKIWPDCRVLDPPHAAPGGLQ